MYTLELGLAACALAILSLLCVPIFSHLRSNIVHHTRPNVENANGGLAKRIVIIVADGLNLGSVGQDFLKDATKGRDIRTISWVDPPTESRTGHGQLLCGVDEDPTALYNAWSKYPRIPDSVLKRAPFAVAIG